MIAQKLIAIAAIGMCTAVAAQPMTIPGLDKDQELAILKAKLAIAEQQAKHAKELAGSVQSFEERRAHRDKTEYMVTDKIRVTEWAAQLDPNIKCTAIRAGGDVALSCVRR